MHNHLYAPCMQALLAYAVSWPKLDKVKDLLIGLRVIFVALLFRPKFKSSLEFVVSNCAVARHAFFIYTAFVFISVCRVTECRSMTHSIQIYVIYALLNSRLLYRRHASQLVTVQSPSWSSETLALTLRANGKRRGSNRTCSCPQQVHGLVLATSRFEQ